MSKSNTVLYWSCQLLGWGVYFIFLTASMLMFQPDNTILIKLQVIITGTLITTSHGLRHFFKWKQWTRRPIKWVLPRIILLLTGASVVAQIVIHLMMVFLINWLEYRAINVNEFFVYVANVFIIFCVWSLLYFSYHYWQNNRRKELENWQLKAKLNEAELTILKSQINPHFLFNALNNIRALILLEPEKARDMVTHISDLMRYFIQFNSKEKVSVSEEMAVVADYLALEKIQFDDRLQHTTHVADETMQEKIPPMSVQLLVENAVKHGISQLPNGGIIEVHVKTAEQAVVIEVINTGQLSNQETDSGTGLRNLHDRIALLFGTEASVSLANHSSELVKASIKIPI